MKDFFKYTSPYRTGEVIELSTAEYVVPFLVLGLLVFLLITYKDIFKGNQKLEKRFRYIVGIVFTVVYASHYLLRFSIYGFDTIILPFQLCSISMFFAILLLFTKNRTVYAFVLYAGVLGGLISLFTPVIGYNSAYYRYYQFYIAHILLIMTPIYYMSVHDYYPSKKETINAFLILQTLAIFMGFFNYFTNSDFMFIFVDPAKITKFPVIKYFGGIPYYLILVEITGILLFVLLFKVTKFIRLFKIKAHNQKKLEVLEE